MASPITITTTPIMVAKRERNRHVIRFQNTGTHPVYITKQSPDGGITTPSVTNYDYVIPPVSDELPEGGVVEVRSIARFDAVAGSNHNQDDKTPQCIEGKLAIVKTFLVR